MKYKEDALEGVTEESGEGTVWFISGAGPGRRRQPEKQSKL